MGCEVDDKGKELELVPVGTEDGKCVAGKSVGKVVDGLDDGVGVTQSTL